MPWRSCRRWDRRRPRPKSPAASPLRASTVEHVGAQLAERRAKRDRCACRKRASAASVSSISSAICARPSARACAGGRTSGRRTRSAGSPPARPSRPGGSRPSGRRRRSSPAPPRASGCRTRRDRSRTALLCVAQASKVMRHRRLASSGRGESAASGPRRRAARSQRAPAAAAGTGQRGANAAPVIAHHARSSSMTIASSWSSA